MIDASDHSWDAEFCLGKKGHHKIDLVVSRGCNDHLAFREPRFVERGDLTGVREEAPCTVDNPGSR